MSKQTELDNSEKIDGNIKEKGDWEIKAWLGLSKNGKTFYLTATDKDKTLIGMCSKKTIEKLINGDITGAPFSQPE